MSRRIDREPRTSLVRNWKLAEAARREREVADIAREWARFGSKSWRLYLETGHFLEWASRCSRSRRHRQREPAGCWWTFSYKSWCGDPRKVGTLTRALDRRWERVGPTPTPASA